jgi:ABC-2 type transport system permease protein
MFFLGAMVMGSGERSSVAMTASAYYFLLPGLISAIFVCITANKLVAAQVDKGTMAYILSTPVKRSKVAVTQAVFFLGAVFAMYLLGAATHILAQAVATGGITGTDVGTIFKINAGLFFLNAALGGICYLASCYFNLSKYAIAAGGGIVGAFHLMSLVGMFSKPLEWLQKLSLVTLFDPRAIAAGSNNFIWEFIILAAVGALTFALGSYVFTKRDLPL